MRFVPLDPSVCAEVVASTQWQARVQKEGDCTLWSFANNTGYGSILLPDGHRVQAHRVAYVAATGSDIPPGMQLDHLCRIRRCVNVAHLEAVTPGENIGRSPIHNQRMRARTHCPQGHPLTPENLSPYYMKRGVRACQICMNERSQARRDRGKS